jgi:hydrogenase nickel incorporation protein HypA/HybF
VHELAIARSVVAVAAEHADGRRVTRVELRIGHLRQVVPGALRLAFPLAAAGTPVEGAELAIEPVPARVACRACGGAGEAADFPLACPACGGVDVELVAGEELLVTGLEVEEPDPAAEEAAQACIERR